MAVDLTGKIAVVTGAASGVGRGLAQSLVEVGAHVVMADVNEGGLEEARDEIGSDRCTIRATDVSDAESVNSLADFTWSELGGADVVCNNAGIIGPDGDPLWELAPAEWERVFSVNFFGCLHGIQAFVPRLLEDGRPAHLVNTASLSGWRAGPTQPEYQASKRAVVAMTEVLRLQLEARDSAIKVVMVSPGPVKSNIVAAEIIRQGGTPHEGSQDEWAARNVGAVGARLSGYDVGKTVLRAIERDQFYVFPNQGSRELIESWMDPLWASFDD